MATVVRLMLVDPGRDETDDLSLTDFNGALDEETVETVESLLLIDLVEAGGPIGPFDWKEGIAGREDEEDETEEVAGMELIREGLKEDGAGGGGGGMATFFDPPKKFLSFLDAGATLTTSGLASAFSCSL